MNSLFECANSPCHCSVDIVNVTPGAQPKATFKIYSEPERSLLYSYIPGSGLNLTGAAGKVYSKNILGQLCAIPEDDVSAYIAFFEQYGFLMPVSTDRYEAIEGSDIAAIVNRIKALLHLLNGITKKDYRKMLLCSAYLLYTKPVSVTANGFEYSTCHHEFTDHVWNYRDYPDLSRDREAFNTGKHSFDDTFTGNKNAIDMAFFNAVRSGSDSGVPGTSDPLFANLFAMYTGLYAVSPETRIITDFFFHYQTEVAVFNEISFGHISYYGQRKTDDFTESMKKALLQVARIVVSEEINQNITGIHPKYDTNLTPVWQVGTLLQALYFSLFYLKAGVEIYKECKNPRCKRDKYFLVEATRTNKDYCCVQCARAAAAQRYRNKKGQK